MKRMSQVFSRLRRKNIRQYALLCGCCFFSVLLITAYVCMMRSPTVLNVLPEGGDSRKQVMMIFALAVVGCGVFTTYASGLFFRYKSREVGIFMALGACKRLLRRQLTRELALIATVSCALGAFLGAPLAWGIWQIFRLAVVDTQEMSLRFDPQSYVYTLVFSVFVLLMLFIMLSRFVRRTNIMDVVNESRKSEPIREVKQWYGVVGIILLAVGGLLGYLTPSILITVFHWYPPGALTAPLYLPALIGLYMILLHTVVNGWRRGGNRYKKIIGTSMMKFHGRQTVRNMLVITVLVAGAYFAAFYTPMLGTGAMLGFDARPVDYAFHYRADQNMPTETEIRSMAAEEGAAITDYTEESMAILGVDGIEHIEHEGSLGTTYTEEYRELHSSESFLSESAYNRLTGAGVDVAPGTVITVLDDEGGGYVSTQITLVTNAVTGQALEVTPEESSLHYSMLLGKRVLDDEDYNRITQGLTSMWQERQVFFNTDTDSYDFAKRLFYTIVDSSSEDVEVMDYWDPLRKMQSIAANEEYWPDDWEGGYGLRDSSEFRMYWKYMPQFRVLDKADFVKTTAVFLMLFIFISIVCFAAVIVIAYTRSLTIGLTNARVYDDLRHLGAKPHYLVKTVKGQISKVFFAPIFAGTTIIYFFYMMIMFLNDGGGFSRAELAGLAGCLVLIAAASAALYFIYRFTLRSVCKLLRLN